MANRGMAGIPPPQGGGCFPSNATVTLSNGKTVTMEELETGDNVLTINMETGKKEFSTVYMWGHRDADTTENYYEVTTENGAKIVLTNEHYLYVAENGYTGSTFNNTTKLKPSLLKPGQALWVMTASGLECSNITTIKQAKHRGLFNPFTLSGTIVVDGVLASCYSESETIPIENMLRSISTEENVARNAPYLHHMFAASARQIFKIIGLDATKCVTSPYEKNGWKDFSLSKISLDIMREQSILKV